ncbi:uncharacterized protein BT62DRAFT_925775 [Guyanagaster necrorhizus]|uniref:Uncharacterized protein n=1 Tax=Guyanagaster necrorhizus TaxID=856835 RepID=A0A9P7W610_9AGAR|nr:uncharacterized protein BT62DRAFT_925775 [Guyanagaster necrorhizus MCA 3950]KAG7453234.1 hypothetical protein BT62DRAFT_925775 [Guyanagaster necrorhizus MCA 3950]
MQPLLRPRDPLFSARFHVYHPFHASISFVPPIPHPKKSPRLPAVPNLILPPTASPFPPKEEIAVKSQVPLLPCKRKITSIHLLGSLCH